MEGIIVDIGTGGGEFVKKLAQEYPDRLFIGIDPSVKPLQRISRQTSKDPKKGGLANVLFVLANVKDLPIELNDSANQVFINFPWGSLLRGVVVVEESIWLSIKRICKVGAYIDLVFGYDPVIDQAEIERLGLPALSQSYIDVTMSNRLENLGFETVVKKHIESGQLKSYPSGWAKKLAYGRDRDYYYLRLIVR